MIVRTDAVVLRAIEYSETSLIVTLFTRRHGQLTVMAKGARRPKSRFGSALQPMAYVQVVYYYKPERGLQTLTESAHVHVLNGISNSMAGITAGLRMVELVRALTEDAEQNALLFNVLVQSLLRLNEAEAHAANVLPYFQLRLAAVLGFSPDVRREAVQALGDEGGVLALDSGAVAPPGAAPKRCSTGSAQSSPVKFTLIALRCPKCGRSLSRHGMSRKVTEKIIATGVLCCGTCPLPWRTDAEHWQDYDI